MSENAVVPAVAAGEQITRLEARLQRARHELREAERELAEKQAAVNAFRLHARLQLDDLAEQVLALRTERQAALTRLQLLRQAQDLGRGYDEDDPFWWGEEATLADEAIDDLPLPTEVSRDKAAEKRLYRELARKFHPDLAMGAVEASYRTSMMALVNQAYEQQDMQALYDLAGQLEPSQMAELAAIQNEEVRRLRQQILNCRRRRRRAQQRLRQLLTDNTARLWRRAQHLDSAGHDWWREVRHDLEQAIDQLQKDIASLRAASEFLETSRETAARSQHATERD